MRTRFWFNSVRGGQMKDKIQVQDQELDERGEPGLGLGVRGERRTKFRVWSKRREENQVQSQELEERGEPGSGLGVK